MENRQRKYSAVVNLFFTREIYHAHMEVQMMITATERTVMKREVQKASINPVFLMPFT